MPHSAHQFRKARMPRNVTPQQTASADLDHWLHAIAFVILRRQMRAMRNRA